MTTGASGIAPSSTYTPLTSTDPAAIAVIRLGGPAFETFAHTHLRYASDVTLTPGAIRRAVLHDTDGEPIDDIILSVRSAAPAWDVWLHLHGGPWITRRCGELLARAGFVATPPSAAEIFASAAPIDAAIAERLPAMLTLAGVGWLTRQGEVLPRFVRRLAAAAEGHPHPVRRACARLATTIEAFDWYARPLRIALIGPPNAGKSTLFNRLVGDAVSITSPRAGTTRDYVEAPGEIAGFPVVWIDTAGAFEAADPLDAAGVAASAAASLSADVRVVVLDASTLGFGGSGNPYLGTVSPQATVINKIDVVRSRKRIGITPKCRAFGSVFELSALTGNGISEFRSGFMCSIGRSMRVAMRPAVFTASQADRARAAAACDDSKSLKEMILRITA